MGRGPLVDTVPPLAYRLVTLSSASIYYPIVDTLLPIALSLEYSYTPDRYSWYNLQSSTRRLPVLLALPCPQEHFTIWSTDGNGRTPGRRSAHPTQSPRYPENFLDL